MSTNHTIIYIMRHIDIGGYISIPYKKIGITGLGQATLDKRLRQISSTKSPIQAQFVAAWQHEDARKVETALHDLLDPFRVEGEWFYDEDDTLQKRMVSIMGLVGAIPIPISDTDDPITKTIAKREKTNHSKDIGLFLSEISEQLNVELKTKIRLEGPTFFSEKLPLTYYANYRKSGKHRLHFGRSKKCFSQLNNFLKEFDYELEETNKGNGGLINQSTESIASVINLIETQFTLKD